MNVAGRGHWASRIGFVLAAAGSAIGLGNVWKFPYITGVYGGGGFLFVYLGCIAIVGIPIMFAELMLGKLTQRDPVGAFRELEGAASPWQVVGWMGVLAAFVILSFYSVVAGWSLAFIARSLAGSIAYGTEADAIAGLFGTLAADPFEQVFWHLLFMLATVSIVSAGIHRGIERWARILMPSLLILLLVLFGYAMTLDQFGRGAEFLFALRFEHLSGEAVLEAMGHAFFTLSLGMGAMITYGSYLEPRTNVVSAGLSVVALDTLIALLAGMVIFPIVFQFGLEAGAGPGLIFETLPVAFAQLPGGTILSTMFFVLLTFAALTSAISLLEVAVAFFHDEFGWDRRLASFGLGLVIFLVGIPAATFGAFFNFLDQLSANYLLPLGGLGIAVYAGWVMDRVKASGAMGEGVSNQVFRLWLGVVRYVTPILVIVVFLNKIGILNLTD